MPGRVVSWSISACSGSCCMLPCAGLACRPSHPSRRQLDLSLLPAKGCCRKDTQGGGEWFIPILQILQNGFNSPENCHGKGKIQKWHDWLFANHYRGLPSTLLCNPPTPPETGRHPQIYSCSCNHPPARAVKDGRKRKQKVSYRNYSVTSIWRRLP